MSYPTVDIEDIVSLDWRDDVKRSAVLAAIHKVLTEFDRNGEINVQLADGRGPKVVGLRRVRGQIMEVRFRKTAVRRLNCERNIRFIAKFVRVGLWLAHMVGRQEPSLCRAIQYSLRNDEMSADDVKQMIYNWAVTLEMHPYRFGLLLQEDGEVFIGSNWKITAWSISNIFEDAAATREGVVIEGRGKIPRMIHRMSLRNAGNTKTMLKAVIVTEHRGLNLEARGWAAQAEDVIVVMVYRHSLLCYVSELISLLDRRVPLNGDKGISKPSRSD